MRRPLQFILILILYIRVYTVTIFIYKYSLQARVARLAKKSFLFGHLFFNLNITNVFCAKKADGACLYMPQDGHCLASCEVIPPKS